MSLLKDMGSEMFIFFLSHYLVFHEELVRVLLRWCMYFVAIFSLPVRIRVGSFRLLSSITASFDEHRLTPIQQEEDHRLPNFSSDDIKRCF